MTTKQHKIQGSKVQNVPIHHGRKNVKVISIHKSQIQPNHKGMYNIGLIDTKSGEYVFNFHNFITESKKESTIKKLEEIVDVIEDTKHDSLLSDEDLEAKYNDGVTTG